MMSLSKNKTIEVPPDEPFKYDVLKRAEEIINLTSVIDSIQEPFVLSLNGQWGSGKTTFIRLWQQHLENEGFITLNYNSWENDSSKEPIISLVGEIQEQIAKRYKNRSLTAIVNSLKETSGRILSKTIPAAIKLGTYGILDIKSDPSIESTLADFFSQLPEEYIKYKGEREKFKTKLSQFAGTLVTNGNLDSNKKIVFFIDELDRCRPTFAVELLERMKHFFNIEKYVFILAMDKDQLGFSLQTLYGTNMDTDGYLRRFIDFNYNITTPPVEDFINLLSQNLGFKGIFESKYLSSTRPQFFMKTLIDYCYAFKLSLREIEQLFFQLKIIIPQIDFQALYIMYTMPLLLVLRMRHPKIYNNYINRRTDSNEIIQLISTNKDVQRLFRRFSQDFLNIRVPEYLKVISVSSEIEADALSRSYIESQKGQPESYTKAIYSELDRMPTYFLNQKAFEKLKGIIEFSARIY
jgi:hypothetical protein